MRVTLPRPNILGTKGPRKIGRAAVGNGTRTSLSYDDADRLTRIVHLKSSNVTIVGFSYKYDKTGRRTRKRR
jgi:hypothetical protein